jgi:hypothetical protein
VALVTAFHATDASASSVCVTAGRRFSGLKLFQAIVGVAVAPAWTEIPDKVPK